MKNKIYLAFQKNGVEIDKDVYGYGFNVLINYSIFLIVTIPLSLYLNVLWEVFLFIICYIPLRRYVGGFHFNKTQICLTFSIILPILFSITANHFEITNVLTILCIYLLMIYITYKIGVVDHPNKVLSEKEKAIYKKKSLIIEFIYMMITILCFITHLKMITNIIFITSLFSVFGIAVTQLYSKK